MKNRSAANAQRTPQRRKSTIPREFLPLLSTYGLDPQQGLELWSYALVLLMLEEGRVRMTGTHQAAGREWLTLQIQGGEEFEIIRPALSAEHEQRLLAGVRDIVARVRASGGNQSE